MPKLLELTLTLRQTLLSAYLLKMELADTVDCKDFNLSLVHSIQLTEPDIWSGVGSHGADL